MVNEEEDDEVNQILADLSSGVVHHDPVKYAQELLEKQQNIGKTSLALVNEKAGQKENDILAILANATMGEKMKYAMLGNSTCRRVLIFDRNAMVAKAVLKNPRLGPTEVEEVVKNTQSSDTILRFISDDIAWSKHYTIRLMLVKNPKTPAGLAMKWLRYLQKPDVKEISRSKNVPNVVATAAKRLLGPG